MICPHGIDTTLLCGRCDVDDVLTRAQVTAQTNQAKEKEMSDSQAVPFDDELPAAPATEGMMDAPVPEVEIDGTMEPDVVARGQEFGDPVPAGVYHIRLVKYEKKNKAAEDGLGPLPYFACQFEVLDPQFAGRRIFDNVPWLRPDDRKRAQMGDPAAQTLVANRLGKIKQLQHSCGFNPTGPYDVMKHFFDTKPECKVKVKVSAKMDKDPATGEWTVDTGDKRNDVVKYIPLMQRG